MGPTAHRSTVLTLRGEAVVIHLPLDELAVLGRLVAASGRTPDAWRARHRCKLDRVRLGNAVAQAFEQVSSSPHPGICSVAVRATGPSPTYLPGSAPMA